MSAPTTLGLTRFKLERELGSGATGTVHEAVLARPLGKLRPGTRVAVKFLHQTQTADPSARKRFLREAKLGLAVRHPNLVRVHAVEEVTLLGQNFLYLVMEYIEGETLRDLLGQGGPLAEALVRSIGRQVASALAALHGEGIVHFDVKPENVVLTKDHRVVLMDLGFARQVQSNSESEEFGSFQGSVAYAAPERIRNKGSRPDPRSDLYALGVMLHELAAGKRPFPQEDISALLHAQLEETPPPPSQSNPRVSAFLDALVGKLLAKDPGERFANAGEVAKILEEGERSNWWRKRISDQRAAPSFQLSHRIPFAGRKREIEMLHEAWKKSRRGRLRFVAISGEEGLGKSRLVDEFAARLRQEANPPLTLYGRSRRLEDPVPFEPLIAALERYLGLPRKSTPGPAEEKRLRKLLPLEDCRRLLGSLQGESAALAGSEELLAESFARFLAAISGEGPAVLFLDDFSSSDHGTQLCLARLPENERIPLLVLLALRPSLMNPEGTALLGRLEAKQILERIALEPLSAKAIEEVLRSLLVPKAPVKEWTDALEERGAQNPAVLAEILRTLQDRGDFVEHGGRWEPRRSPREIPIPESAADALRARRDLLADEERALLECASVAGTRFEVDRLAAAFDLDPLKALQILSQIERRYRLLASAGSEFRFARPVVREILYHDLPPETRALAHRRLALQIEKESKGKTATLLRESLALADHAAKSGDDALALRVIEPLIPRMAERGYFEQARRFAKIALDHLRKDDAEPQTRRRRFRFLLHAAEAESRLGLREEEKRDLEECARIATELNDSRLRAETFFHLGRYAFNTGKYLVALNFFQRAEQIYETLRDAAGLAEARLQRGHALSYLGEREGAKEVFQSLLDANPNPQIKTRARLGLGRVLVEQGQSSAGLALLEKAVKRAKPLGDLVLESLAQLYLGRALVSLEKYARALPPLDKGIALARQTGERRTLCLLEIEKARALTQDKKRRAEAGPLIEHAISTAEEIQDAYAKATALVVLAEWKHRTGAPLGQRQQAARLALRAAEDADLEDLQVRARRLLD